jgi:hypothetical protein
MTEYTNLLARFRDADGAYDLAADPTAATRAGAALAEMVRSAEATVVLSWAGENESLLAHVVASELGLPRAVVELDLGLLTVSPPLAEASRVVLVATEFSARRPIDSIATMLASRNHQLTAVAALSASEELSADTAAAHHTLS